MEGSARAESERESGGDADELLRIWEQRATLSLVSYNRAANRCRVWDTGLGGTSAVLAAAAGTAVFASLQESVSVGARVAVGAITVAASVLAGIQTFAGLPGRVEAYEKAGRRFGSVRRDIEQARLALQTDPGKAEAMLQELAERLDQAAENSPNAPPRIRDRTNRHLKGQYTWWEVLGRRLKGLPKPSRLGRSEHSDRFREAA